MTTNDRPPFPALTSAAEPGGLDAQASQATTPGSPTSEVIVLAADDGAGHPLPRDQRQSWCRALHDLIVSGAGQDAITGDRLLASEGHGAPLVHYLPACVLGRSNVADLIEAPGAFLIVLPQDMDDEEATAVLATVTGLTRLLSGSGQMRLQVVPAIVAAELFWRAPDQGLVRLWASPSECGAVSAIGCAEDVVQLEEGSDGAQGAATALRIAGQAGAGGAGVLIPVDLPQDLVDNAGGVVW